MCIESGMSPTIEAYAWMTELASNHSSLGWPKGALRNISFVNEETSRPSGILKECPSSNKCMDHNLNLVKLSRPNH